MINNPAAQKMSQVIALTPEERAALAAISRRGTRVVRGTDIILQGEVDECAFLIHDGWALRHRQLADGRRQVLHFLVPGDWAGLTALMFPESDHAVTTVTDAVVAALSLRDLATLFQSHPRLGLAIYWTAAQEEAIIAEHLVNVGRRSAYERLGNLFLELLFRLQLVGRADHRAFAFPVSQAVVADSLGLTQVHVNRTLRRLHKDGFVAVSDRRVVILDQAGLEQALDFESAYLHMAGPPAWLRRRSAQRPAAGATPPLSP
ncbi:MAG TPA: Crp/Fnr family transcriptional regulator [Kiloniellales bacterium]